MELKNIDNGKVLHEAVAYLYQLNFDELLIIDNEGKTIEQSDWIEDTAI